MVDFKTGVGDPSSPYYGQVLSHEDETRLGADGRIVVKGLPWGKASTGLYLTVFGHKLPDMPVLPGVERTFVPSTNIQMAAGVSIFVACHLGKCRAPGEGFGASLELPSDLGRDALKQAYVSEWLVETTQEVLQGMKGMIPAGKLDDFAYALQVAANDAIEASGL